MKVLTSSNWSPPDRNARNGITNRGIVHFFFRHWIEEVRRSDEGGLFVGREHFGESDLGPYRPFFLRDAWNYSFRF